MVLHPDQLQSLVASSASVQFQFNPSQPYYHIIVMSSTTTTTADVAGVWFGELSAMLRGKKQQAMTVSHAEQQQRQMRVATHGKKNLVATKAVAKPAGDGKRTKETGGGGMSEATVYLLLDRFAPS